MAIFKVNYSSDEMARINVRLERSREGGASAGTSSALGHLLSGWPAYAPLDVRCALPGHCPVLSRRYLCILLWFAHGCQVQDVAHSIMHL